MQVATIINKVRFKANDTSEIAYSDYDVLCAINDANRIFYDVCKDEAPELISSDYDGVLLQGDNIIYFTDNRPNDSKDKEYKDYFNVKPSRIIELRCSGRRLHSAVHTDIANTTVSGTPKVFTLGRYGKNMCIKLYPVPAENIRFSLRIIEEVEELKPDGELMIPADFIEYMVEFVASVLQGKGDVGEFKEALVRELRRMIPSVCVVDSYY